jgi:hypothetical protein
MLILLLNKKCPFGHFLFSLFFFYVLFCGIIISVMKTRKLLFSLLTVLSVSPAIAGWQYDGYYVDDGYYTENDVRFVIGFRGGVSWANARIKNEIGNLDGYYYMDVNTESVVSETLYDAAVADGLIDADDYVYLGTGDLSSLKAKKDFSKWSFTAGGSIGFTIPYHPRWRLEAGYDHISETSYNQIPLFEGDLTLSGGDTEGNVIVHIASSGVTSNVSTDVISAMAYYDFFEGNTKPLNTIVPYIGLGLGYATSKTTMKLADIYGDLSTSSDLANYGTPDSSGVIQFEPPTDKSKFPSSENIAAIAALGLSYGISDYTYLDFGARVMYIPKITWELVNSDASLHREWFSARDMLYTNFTVGLRFEF